MFAKRKPLALVLALALMLSALPSLSVHTAYAADVSSPGQRIARDGHTLIVDANGAVRAWGNNSSGQVGNGTKEIVTEPLSVLQDAKYVAASQYVSFAIKNDNSLWFWGSHRIGLDTSHPALIPLTRNELTPVKVLDDVVSINTVPSHSFAVKSDGSLWGWGNGRYLFGTGNNDYFAEWTKIMDGVKSVATGHDHTLILMADGTLMATGLNTYLQLGIGSEEREVKTLEKVMDGVAAIEAINNNSYAIKTDGSLWGWGDGGLTLMNAANDDAPNVSTPIKLMDNVRTVKAGSTVFAVKTDNTLWGWGYNANWSLGDGTSNVSAVPIKILDNVAEVASGYAIRTDGSVYTWGGRRSAMLPMKLEGITAAPVMAATTPTATMPTTTAVQVSVFPLPIGRTSTTINAASSTATYAVRNNGQLMGFGQTRGYKNTETDVAAISGSSDHAMFIKTDGSLWGWGSNDYGEVGDGTKDDRRNGTAVKVMDGVKSVTTYQYTTLAVKSDNSLWIWGQVPDETRFGYSKAQTTSLKIMDSVSSVSKGLFHVMALKTDGSLWTWGTTSGYSNQYGQMGLGGSVDPQTAGSTPAGAVKIMDGVASVSAGGQHTAIIKTDGTLWMCGYNGNGQLGTGNSTNAGTPVQVLDGVASVSSGDRFTVALKTDGSLWTWGANTKGQLGDGTTEGKNIPTKIGDGFVQISAGTNHTVAQKMDGTVWEWGEGSSNKVNLSPIQIMEDVKLPN